MMRNRFHIVDHPCSSVGADAGVSCAAHNAFMPVVRRADLVAAPMSVRDVADLVADRSAGAVVTFSGDVRDHDHGHVVARLEYEGHPTAGAVIAAVGESALVAAVSSAHRAEAFAACGDLVDEVKRRLPVWKHQVFADGTDEWVNCA